MPHAPVLSPDRLDTLARDSEAAAVGNAGLIRVLIAEGEPHLGAMLEHSPSARGLAMRSVRGGRAALEVLRSEPFDVALLDVVMPDVDALEVLRQLRGVPQPPEIILMSGHGTIETALAALQLGAYDFLSKPYRMAEVDALVQRAWEKRMLLRSVQHLRARLERQEDMPVFVTQYAPLSAVRSMVETFATSPMPVLVSGEAGTGKTLVARLLHRHGASPAGPFVQFDCAAVDPALHVAELAGVERGSDAAAGHRPGVFELAQGGTLQLRHIEALSPSAQALLLDALDQLAFTRGGGRPRLPFDVRVVVSSTRDLAPLIERGRFGETLWHRLSAIRVAMPPLRDRAVDIPVLAHHLLDVANPGHRLPLRLSDDAVAALEEYPWPGNVRELRLVLERAALLAPNGVVEVEHLALPSATAGRPESPRPTPGHVTGADASPSDGGTPSLGELERRHIAEVLDRTGWHQGRAAERLGISPKTLYRKIREYGFTRPSGRHS